MPVFTARHFDLARSHTAIGKEWCAKIWQTRSWRITRQIGLAVMLVAIGSKGLQPASADGDTRTLTMHHIHTGENITITYKREGRYDPDALKKINWFLRDWRKEEQTNMDPRLLDVVWEVYREVGGKDPIQIVCGYRSPSTNSMLRNRSRSSGVAQFSQHTLGKAMDFFIPGVSLEQQREAGLRLQRGGVGYYPSSGSPFVHMDVGGVRHWPRMTHDQLVRVFPNGRTVHIPSDGHPLAGYALALADIRKHGGSPSALSLQTADNSGVNTAGKPNLLASLFGMGKDDDDDDSAAAAPAAKASSPAARAGVKVADAAETKSEAGKAERAPMMAVPLPPARPARFQVASAQTRPARLTGPVVSPQSIVDSPADVAMLTPNQIIDARGYWQGAPDQQDALAAKLDGPKAPRRTIQTASADPHATGALVALRDRRDASGLPDAALAYASATAADVGTSTGHALPMGSSPLRAARTILRTTADSTIAIKQDAGVRPQPSAAALPRAKAGDHYDQPWQRAMVLAPTLATWMTPTLLGDMDFRTFTTLMQKPRSSAMMTFASNQPYAAATDHFAGPAVIFVATVTFNNRTASLQR